MPSPRVISVAVLVGMGAVVAALGGAAQGDQSGKAVAGQSVRASLIPAGSATATGPAGFDVQAENRKSGTPGWRISRARGTRPGLEAYAQSVSAVAGESVPLAVSGQGTVRVRAFRIGWYGGVGARQIWQGSLFASPEPADPGTWSARGFADTTGWPVGQYLLRLDQGQASRYVPLTIRSPDSAGKILVLTSPLSWQAENTTAPAKAGSPVTRASFDRPYASGYGSGGFLADDEAIVQLAERSGKQLAYATDYDVAGDPALVAGASAVLVDGDSRFWTTSLRTTIRTAAAAGTNLAFFGAGTGSRQVALIDQGRELKISPAPASLSVRLTGIRPSCADRPEPVTAAGTGWMVSNSDWWGYRGAGVSTGDVLPGLVGADPDRASTSSVGGAVPTQVLSFTRISCDAPAGPGSAGGTGTGTSPAVGSAVGSAQSATYQVHPSKAGIFAAGTGNWACTAAGSCVDQFGKPVVSAARSRQFAIRVTRNIIAAFAESRAGERHPARNSAIQYAALH